MKINKRIYDVVILTISVYLIVLFIVSGVISWKTDHNTISVSSEVVIAYALRFLSDEKLIQEGRRMDCSAFTSAVYKKFGIRLPRSSKQQFKNYLNRNGEQLSADLVFFKNNINQISHVGILLNDSTFIHSPGRNKAVRVDSLDMKYWKKYFAGTGSVLYTSKKR